MRLEHIAMYVNDLNKIRDFFVTYFGAVCKEHYHNPTTNFRSCFLTFDSGARLEIMTKPDLNDSGDLLNHLGYSHIAISVGSKESVDTLTDRLKFDGYSVISGPRTTGDGYYENCVLCPEGNLIEITV